jgi:hypothetical protein
MSSEVAIYEPPTESLPYLVVAFAAGGPEVTIANSRKEARVIASEKEIRRRRQKRGEPSRGKVPPAPRS